MPLQVPDASTATRRSAVESIANHAIEETFAMAVVALPRVNPALKIFLGVRVDDVLS
jgi:hypothetical protein